MYMCVCVCVCVCVSEASAVISATADPSFQMPCCSHPACGEIGNLLPNNRRQCRTCYASCHILYPVSAAHTSIFRMNSNTTSCKHQHALRYKPLSSKEGTPQKD